MQRLSPFGKFFLLSFLPVAAMSIAPVLVFFLALIWGAVFIASAFYLSRWQMFIIFAANMAWFYLAGGIMNMAFYLAFIGIPVLVMAYAAAAAKGYYEIQKWGILTAVLCVSVFTGSMYITAGDIGIREIEQDFKEKLEASMEEYEESGFFEIYAREGISREKVEQEFMRITGIIARHLPAFYYLQAIMAAFFSLLLASAWSLKKGIINLKRKPFPEEVMPWQLVWLVILGLALVLIGDSRGETSFLYYTGSNILAVMFPISVYYGIAALVYRLQNMSVEVKRWAIVLLLILTLLLSVFILIFIALTGIFDALLDWRKINKAKEDV